MKQLKHIKALRKNANVNVFNNKAYIYTKDGILTFYTELNNGVYDKKALENGLINKIDDCDNINIDLLKYDKFKYDIKIDLKDLKDFINFVGSDDLRPVMKQICINENGFIYATNAHYLHYKKHNYDLNENILISPIAVKFFNELVKIDVYQNHVVISNDNFTFYQYNEGTIFPNCKAVIPTTNPNKAILNLKDLKTILKEIAFFIDNTTNRIEFSFKNEILTISAGYYSKQINYKGYSNITIGFNLKLLNTYLKLIKTQNLQIELNESNRAAIFNEEFLLMSLMKLKKNKHLQRYKLI